MLPTAEWRNGVRAGRLNTYAIRRPAQLYEAVTACDCRVGCGAGRSRPSARHRLFNLDIAGSSTARTGAPTKHKDYVGYFVGSFYYGTDD
ncbi:MAG: hypothetical protein ACLSVD_02225 [Eggerthellaceae bacterium]